MNIGALLLIFIGTILLGGCLQQSTPNIQNSELVQNSEPVQNSWAFHYQLQDATYAQLRNLHAAVVVVDIDDVHLLEEEMALLRKNNITILSYLSIGEAEDYRGYWKTGWKAGYPSFVDEENPEWEGNYKVRYWDTGWQEIILEKAEEIARRGYDGVYLDIVDAYEYYQEKGRDSAAREMIYFIGRIQRASHQINPNFLIVPQNAPELYENDEYKEIIDGLGKEDIWYDDDEIQNPEETTMALYYLDKVIADGKFVLAIDYPTEQSKICDFYEKCRNHLFACTVSTRELSLSRPVVCS